MQKEQHVQRVLPPRRELEGVLGTRRRPPCLSRVERGRVGNQVAASCWEDLCMTLSYERQKATELSSAGSCPGQSGIDWPGANGDQHGGCCRVRGRCAGGWARVVATRWREGQAGELCIKVKQLAFGAAVCMGGEAGEELGMTSSP